MTRFTRARGAKASNQKLPEEASSWKDLRKPVPEGGENSNEEVSMETNWKKVVEQEEKIELNKNSVWAEFNEEPSKKSTPEGRRVKKNKREVACQDISVEDENSVEIKEKKSRLETDEDGSNSKTAGELPFKQSLKGSENLGLTPGGSGDKRLGKRGKKDFKRRKPDQGNQHMNINGIDVELERFDGFYIKKEDADRLKQLKSKLRAKGVPKKEIDLTIKMERRRAEKALSKMKKRVCFHCRLGGHNLSECPKLTSEKSGSGICYKCGSTEHSYLTCKVSQGDQMKFATCFVCNEEGHIAKHCPDNPRGLYPRGGACRICGDVTHFKKDCPKLASEKAESKITISTISDHKPLEALEDDQEKVNKSTPSMKSHKVVKF